MVFCATDEELAAEDSWKHVLKRHISYFADEDGLNGILQWIGQDNPFFKRIIELAGSFEKEGKNRQPFGQWHYVDPEFRDLIGKMTNLDPKRRITAREALAHPWFEEKK